MRRKALKKKKKNSCWALVFSRANNGSSWDIFHIKNNQLIILYVFWYPGLRLCRAKSLTFFLYLCYLSRYQIETWNICSLPGSATCVTRAGNFLPFCRFWIFTHYPALNSWELAPSLGFFVETWFIDCKCFWILTRFFFFDWHSLNNP